MLAPPANAPATETLPRTESIQTADCVNPLLASTRTVFESMLGCTPTRTGLTLKPEPSARYEISGVIGVTGRVTGTIVLTLPRSAAAAVYERMLGSPLEELPVESRDSNLCDAVGELTNMIAGGAKARMEKLALSISTPNIILGERHVIRFPTNVVPMSIDFTSELGPFAVDFGFAF